MNNQDHFVKWCVGCSILAMVYITLADLNCQNDVRESSESAEKRTKKQIYLSEQFCQAWIFFCKLLFLQSLIFSGSWSMVLIHPDRASPSDVRPSDLPPSHQTYFDTFFINTNAIFDIIDFVNQRMKSCSCEGTRLDPSFICSQRFLAPETLDAHNSFCNIFFVSKVEEIIMISKVRVNLCAVKTFFENSALWNKNKDSIPLNLLANHNPQKAKWTKPHKQTSNIGEMILYAYFNMTAMIRRNTSR